MAEKLDRKAALEKLKNKSNISSGESPESGIPAERVRSSTVEVQEIKKPVELVGLKKTGEEEEETSQIHLPLKLSTSANEIPAKLRRVMSNDDMNYDKTNISIARDLVYEFNLIKQKGSQKRVKTSANSMMSNILREWLQRNSDELQKTFGHKPFANG